MFVERPSWLYPHSSEEADFVPYAAFIETSFCFKGMKTPCSFTRITKAPKNSKSREYCPETTPTPTLADLAASKCKKIADWQLRLHSCSSEFSNYSDGARVSCTPSCKAVLAKWMQSCKLATMHSSVQKKIQGLSKMCGVRVGPSTPSTSIAL